MAPVPPSTPPMHAKLAKICPLGKVLLHQLGGHCRYQHLAAMADSPQPPPPQALSASSKFRMVGADSRRSSGLHVAATRGRRSRPWPRYRRKPRP